MYHSAEMDRTNSKITLLQNTLDKEYLNVSIKQTLGNIGGSYVTNVNEDPSLETVQSILFSDVFEHIQFNKPTTKRLIIILKIDIERYQKQFYIMNIIDKIDTTRTKLKNAMCSKNSSFWCFCSIFFILQFLATYSTAIFCVFHPSSQKFIRKD